MRGCGELCKSTLQLGSSAVTRLATLRRVVKVRCITYSIGVLSEDYRAREACRVVEGALEGGHVVGFVSDEENWMCCIAFEIIYTGY